MYSQSFFLESSMLSNLINGVSSLMSWISVGWLSNLINGVSLLMSLISVGFAALFQVVMPIFPPLICK